MPETKKIALTKGLFALVDGEDFEWLSQWKWFAHKSGKTFYAARNVRVRKGKQRYFAMHRALMNDPKGKEIDHLNHNGLDNRRCNLRVCSHKENMNNMGLNKNNKSGFPGVCWHKVTQKWMAQGWKNDRRIYLGVYEKIEDAIKAREKLFA